MNVARFAICVMLLTVAGQVRGESLEFSTRQPTPGTRVLLVQGVFAMGDEKRFARLVGTERFDEVWFHSPGGNVFAGQSIGRMMRRNGLIGRVPSGASCMSACVDAFLGAPVRFVDEPYSVGVHMFSLYRSEDIQDIVREAREDEDVQGVIQGLETVAARSASRWITYMMEMGVAPSLISWTVNVPHACMYLLSRQEMLHFNVANTVGPPRPGFAPGNGRIEGGCSREDLGL